VSILIPDGSDPGKQYVIMKQARGTYTPIGNAANCFADNITPSIQEISDSSLEYTYLVKI